MKALIIAQPWIDLILSGRKTWEMRSRKTTVRGTIGLIEKGTGTVVGVANLDDCLPAMSRAELAKERHRHHIPDELVQQPGYKWFTPWVLNGARRLPSPVPYEHPFGAVIWVDLMPETAKQVL